MANEESKQVRTYCIKLAQATAKPSVIEIHADEMCEIEPFTRLEFKRDGEIVGSFNTKIAAWWIKLKPPDIRVSFVSPPGTPSEGSNDG